MRIYFLVFFLACQGIPSWAQDSTLTYNAKLTISSATQNPGFFHLANQSSTIPFAKNFVSGRYSFRKISNPGDVRLFQWNAGTELITNIKEKGKTQVFLTDYYISAKIGPFITQFGAKRKTIGITDSTLSIGSLSMSNNARPIPGISLSLPSFLPLGFTNNHLSVMASYSEGLLGPTALGYGSSNSINRTYFHHKQLYFKWGKARDRINLYLGINHQVIWGAEDKIWNGLNYNETSNYTSILTGKRRNGNRHGYHMGTYDLGIKWKSPRWELLIYRQIIHDNASLFKPKNLSDGLLGTSLKNRSKSYSNRLIFSAATFEVISTINQKNQFTKNLSILDEYGNYYNHYAYLNGWAYKGQGIGIPVIPSSAILPAWESESKTPEFSSSNRIMAVHGSLLASWQDYSVELHVLHNKSYGTYLTPFTNAKNQYSVSCQVQKSISNMSGLNFYASWAMDGGKLFVPTHSFQLGIQKNGFILGK